MGRGLIPGSPVGIVIPLSIAEIDEMSAVLVSVGRAGNELVGRLSDPMPVGNSGVGIKLPGSVEEVNPALGAETPGSEGNAVADPTLGTDTPGTDVRTMGGGTTPLVGIEVAGRVGSEGAPMVGRFGKKGGKGKAGEAETWRAYTPSDNRMSWCIVTLLWLNGFV